jgi:hypothetical protein
VLRQFSYEETGLASCKLSVQNACAFKTDHRPNLPTQQQSKQLEYWQKLIDDHTAEEFERDTAAKAHRQLSGCQLE